MVLVWSGPPEVVPCARQNKRVHLPHQAQKKNMTTCPKLTVSWASSTHVKTPFQWQWRAQTRSSCQIFGFPTRRPREQKRGTWLNPSSHPVIQGHHLRNSRRVSRPLRREHPARASCIDRLRKLPKTLLIFVGSHREQARRGQGARTAAANGDDENIHTVSEGSTSVCIGPALELTVHGPDEMVPSTMNNMGRAKRPPHHTSIHRPPPPAEG